MVGLGIGQQFDHLRTAPQWRFRLESIRCRRPLDILRVTQVREELGIRDDMLRTHLDRRDSLDPAY